MMAAGEPANRTDEAVRRARRRRSVAIALALVGFVVILYILTVFRMGPALFDRAL